MHSRLMKNTLLSLLLLAALSGTATSCSDNDGDWTPMKWHTTVVQEKNGMVLVPVEGGTYVFACTNYSEPWMSDLRVETNGQETIYHPEADFHSVSASGLEAQWEGAVLTITVAPCTTQASRNFQLTVTAGNIFHTFRFSQQAAR